jgi:cytochrome c oxidase subunit II
MNQAVFSAHGPGAQVIADLSRIYFGVCAVVYVLVVAAMFWAIGRRGRESDATEKAGARITRTVAAATIVTALTLVFFTVINFAAARGLGPTRGPDAITVDVIGHQWWWEFQYRDVTPSDWVNSPNELHIPVGVRVALNVSSRDVIHSFWVPNLQGKRDLIPGMTTRFWIQADAPGTYRGQCAEFCGFQHAQMALLVVAEPMDEFLAWIANQRKPAREPATDDERRGRDLFLQSSCVLCHTIRGTDAGSRVGPELTHVASRQSIAAGTLPNTRQDLERWIADPHAVKPGVRMPASPLAGADLQAVVTFVRSLQ